MAKKAESKTVEAKVKQLEISTIAVDIVGTSPLMVHKWSQKVKEEMLAKQMKTAKNKPRSEKNPTDDYLNSIYWIDQEKNRTGFPAVGFKAAMVRAGKSLGYNMTDLKGWLFVEPDVADLVEIFGDHEMDESVVRVANGGADLRYRARYDEWKATVTIQFNAGNLSHDEVLQIMLTAGFSCGIGEWRPEKSASGMYGRWNILM